MKTLTINTHTALGVLLSSCALILGSAFSSAQTPTPCPADVTPPMPPQETLDAAFQPHIYDSNDITVLRRLRYAPSGSGPWPTVLVIHGGEFKIEDDRGSLHQEHTYKDLNDAGFLVFSIECRLAPPGLITHQTAHDTSQLGVASGRPPQQSNDVKQEILAALADPQCNQEIFLIGGSSGGTHALWCALDPNATVPGWSSMTIAKIKAVVGLSGNYDLSLRVPPPSQSFILDVNNYTNTIEGSAGCVTTQYQVSPISLVGAAQNICPVRLYATVNDDIPPAQATNMATALQNKGVDVIEYTLAGSASSLHAFQYWHEINSITSKCVSTEVIDFFNLHR